MKTINQYLVTYGCVSGCSGNECPWIDTVTVSARNKRESCRDVESELRDGIEIISIVELWKQSLSFTQFFGACSLFFMYWRFANQQLIIKLWITLDVITGYYNIP